MVRTERVRLPRRREVLRGNQEITLDLMDQQHTKSDEGVSRLCHPGHCGPEAACRLFPNNTYLCVCPHDSSPPTHDMRCPNRRTVPLTPRPIHNIIPPSGFNLTRAVASNSTRQTESGITHHHQQQQPVTADVSVTLAAALCVSVAAVLAFAATCWWRRVTVNRARTKGRDNQQTTRSPVVKGGTGILGAERYTPNPQYAACACTAPLLRRENIRLVCEVGEGCFGKVFKGELKNDQSDSMKIVAVKVLKDNASLEAEEDFMREVDIMSSFRHKNILSLVGVVLRERSESPWMIFEYMAHGDLAEVLRVRRALSVAQLLRVALHVSSGMRYLAAQRFVHRDLAARNCLVGDGLAIKIAEFGMSRDMYTCDYYKIGGSRLLPVRWMSPESVMYGRFTLESDVWSFGVLLWEVFARGKQPYYGHTNEEVVKLILQGIMLIPPEECPRDVCDVMRCCWKTEPRDRVRFADIHDRLEKTLRVTLATRSPVEMDYDIDTDTLIDTNVETTTSNTKPGFENSPVQTLPEIHAPTPATHRTVTPNSDKKNRRVNGFTKCQEWLSRRSDDISRFQDPELEEGKRERDSGFLDEDRRRSEEESGGVRFGRIPRPPPIPFSELSEFRIDLLDSDGYLMPQKPNVVCEYLQTFAD